MVTNNMYLYSLIARAAYCDFNSDISFKDALETTGIFKFNKDDTNNSHVMANDFVSVYKVIYQYNDPLTGFSGTVFKDNSEKYIIAFRGTELGDLSNSDPLDLVADTEIAATGLAANQIYSLEVFADNLGAYLPANASFDVVGDSLGGHLAQAFVAKEFSRVDKAVIFESPRIIIGVNN